MTEVEDDQHLSERQDRKSDLIAVAPFADGQFFDSGSPTAFSTHNPATGAENSQVPIGCRADVDRAVRAARSVFDRGNWRHAPPSKKKAILRRWADLIDAAAERLDRVDAMEMGKPISLKAFCAASAADLVRFNAEAIDKIAGDMLPSDLRSTIMQKRVPRGVVGAIVPWNFPTYNILLKVAPALAAGNSVVLKPSELANQSALMLAMFAIEAGLPAGAFNVVPGKGEIVGRAIAEHMDVDMVTFTGSSEVGKLMLHYAGRSNLKVVNAECGGKSPQVVFDDGVDLELAADGIARSIVTNSGQVCSVGSRLLVQKSIEQAFVKKVAARLASIVAGDPLLPTTTYGPLASTAQLDKVMSFIRSARDDGAQIAAGGGRMPQPLEGCFVEPTIVTHVSGTSRIAQEEVFGPVLCVQGFEDLEDAVRLANGTCYGLAAYLWTSRIDAGFKFANAVNSAVTLVNAGLPFGEGPGHAFSGEPHGLSGIGVEGGLAGLKGYMRHQTMWFNHG